MSPAYVATPSNTSIAIFLFLFVSEKRWLRCHQVWVWCISLLFLTSLYLLKIAILNQAMGGFYCELVQNYTNMEDYIWYDYIHENSKMYVVILVAQIEM